MLTKEDISLLVTYFDSLTTIPEELTTLVEKLNLLNTLQITQDSLMELMKGENNELQNNTNE